MRGDCSGMVCLCEFGSLAESEDGIDAAFVLVEFGQVDCECDPGIHSLYHK